MDVVSLGLAKAHTRRTAVLRRMNTMVVAGDSLTNNGGGPGLAGNGARTYRPGAAWTWANQLLGHRVKILKNAGIGGETSTQLLARWATDVLAFNPSWVHLLIGTNDAGISSTSSAVPLATTQVNILSMIDQSQAQGSGILIGTIPPRGSGGTNTRGAAAQTHALTLNAWIRNTLPFLRPGIVVVDYYSLMADPANPDQWLPSYVLPDGTHWNGVGGYVAGKLLADILTPLIPALPRVTRVSNDPTNLITTTRGQFAGAAAGVAPGGWTTSQAAMVTGLEARADGIPGNWLVITVPAGGTFQMSRDITAGLAVGDTVLTAVEFQASGIEQPTTPTAANQALSWGLLVAPDFITTSDMSAVNGSDPAHGNQARSGVLECPPYTRQAADTSVQVGVTIKGGGVYRFANATATKQ